MNPDFLRDNILLFGPGFVYVKLVYLFGEQHRRLEWEWVVWSLVAGLPIAFAAEWISTGYIPDAVPSAQDPAHGLLRFLIAIVAAVVTAFLWRRIRFSDRWLMGFVRRSLSDSAWDYVLDRAVHDGSGAEVTVQRIDDAGATQETAFYGNLSAFGHEAAGADPMVYLTHVRRWVPSDQSWMPVSVENGSGIMFDRSNILRLRIVPKTASAPAADPAS